MVSGQQVEFIILPLAVAFLKYDTFIVKIKRGYHLSLLGTLLTIAAGFEHPRSKYMLTTGISLFVHVLFHVVWQRNDE